MVDYSDGLCLSICSAGSRVTPDTGPEVEGGGDTHALNLHIGVGVPEPVISLGLVKYRYPRGAYLHAKRNVSGPLNSLLPQAPSMERVRLDDNQSPPPTGDSATPFNQADPSLLTPNRRVFAPDETTLNLPYTDKPQHPTRKSLYPKIFNRSFDSFRSKSFFQDFERPNLARIAILTVLCLAAYPALYILTLVAKDKSLFVVRLIVAMWCSGVGFALGYLLLRIGVQHLEAASEWFNPVVTGHR